MVEDRGPIEEIEQFLKQERQKDDVSRPSADDENLTAEEVLANNSHLISEFRKLFDGDPVVDKTIRDMFWSSKPSKFLIFTRGKFRIAFGYSQNIYGDDGMTLFRRPTEGSVDDTDFEMRQMDELREGRSFDYWKEYLSVTSSRELPEAGLFTKNNMWYMSESVYRVSAVHEAVLNSRKVLDNANRILAELIES